ncbi:hypothetical protein DEH84_06895 [Aquabacterium olei]|uniref:Uncharacterized protein n=1 Tax=Aquabacterium olei TaxID=1296669 RepID=A0A2U8FSE0_9BURK|nr:hypothetical protein [Aquabacterium olei]AWI53186.1 hypothetical protein DEH84_06895 [Aquabacterium olei]
MTEKNSTQPMGLRAYWKHVGTDNAKKVAEKVETSWGYFRAMAYGQKRPSYDMAKNLIAAAQAVTPGWAPDLELLMEGPPKPLTNGRRGRPSAAFLASQAAQGRGAAA